MNKLEMRGIRKSFGGIHALRGVDISLRKGEVLGLMGENGAGKSTLMKILAGAVDMDAGEIRIDGRPCLLDSPAAALSRGVSVIYQELNMARDLTVAENIYLGTHLRSRGWVDWQAMRRRSSELLAELGAPGISPRAAVKNLS
ncbi:MAG: ATP-binding cassette domain-containing protein, partial [Planctomycetota bacterium]|nr:ATP-binding cassette domain-containing protein [Planctomycetota bacterium]